MIGGPSLAGLLSAAVIAGSEGGQFTVDEINKAGGINGRKPVLLTRAASIGSWQWRNA